MRFMTQVVRDFVSSIEGTKELYLVVPGYLSTTFWVVALASINAIQFGKSRYSIRTTIHNSMGPRLLADQALALEWCYLGRRKYTIFGLELDRRSSRISCTWSSSEWLESLVL